MSDNKINIVGTISSDRCPVFPEYDKKKIKLVSFDMSIKTCYICDQDLSLDSLQYYSFTLYHKWTESVLAKNNIKHIRFLKVIGD